MERRNFGWGKQLGFAGRAALRAQYRGHFGTVHTHGARWELVCEWLKGTAAIRDARYINAAVIEAFAGYTRNQLEDEVWGVAFAHNVLSTVNVVLGALRGDRALVISPVAVLGVTRSGIRDEVPLTLDSEVLRPVLTAMGETGEGRAAIHVSLCRAFGLRGREAALLDPEEASRQATRHGAINVTEGTKGGRRVPRWVPVMPKAFALLQEAVAYQNGARSLVPPEQTLVQYRAHVQYVWQRTTGGTLGIVHDLRAAYACERYAQLTGHPAPVVAGGRTAPREDDARARVVLTQELGHNRPGVVAAYVGSVR